MKTLFLNSFVSAFFVLSFFVFFPQEGQLRPLVNRQKETAEKIDSRQGNQDNVVTFTPPAQWSFVSPDALPGRVRAMVIGKSSSSFPPSINVSSEPYKGTLKQYLKIVKNMNAAQGYDWKDLGTIQTQAGLASLSQVDTKTEWGTVRLMHVILVKNGTVYILTASALKEDFPKYYKDFFQSMKSLKIANDLYEIIPNSTARKELQTAVAELKAKWQNLLSQKRAQQSDISCKTLQDTLFDSQDFQNNLWDPFKKMLKEKYAQQGEEWQSLFLQKLEDELLAPSTC